MIKKAPIKFNPYFKSVIWGGDKICEYKDMSQPEPNIGESWEITGVPGHESIVEDGDYKGKSITELIEEFGEELLGSRVLKKYSGKFPLLIKFIDARDNLSVQVHPNDDLAKKRHDSLGKTEMWYIIKTDKNAKIYAGFKEAINPEDYERRVTDNSFMETVAEHDSKPGDVFFLPAGRVHAIGAGNLLAEIQESSDITYRIYDYNRKDKDGKTRELHTSLAKDAIDYKLYDDLKNLHIDEKEEESQLVSCEHFNVKRIKCKGIKSIRPHEDTFTILMCLDGEINVECEDGYKRMGRGTTFLIPASVSQIRLEGSALLLHISC